MKAIADRLAEAFAEYLHAQARKDWGYEKETPSNADLVAEKYRGIRPGLLWILQIVATRRACRSSGLSDG